MNDIEKTQKENENLKKIDENKSDLISVTAHQLRTSLSALKWILKMFLNKDFGDINSEQKDYLEKAITSNERAISLVNYLLTFNNSETINNIMDFKTVDIYKILENVISLFYGELKNKNIQMNFHNPTEDIPKIKCNEEMITVVFQNLIENAIKYSDTDSLITVSINKDSVENNIVISCNNKGLGIEKEDQSKIFSKFFRAPNAIKKEDSGSGLGLYTAKNIVEKHNGKIWFESGENLGTTFYVSLPIF